MPADSKLEAMLWQFPVFSVWTRQAENSIRVFECVYGFEHGPERREALQALRCAHEEDDVAFPAEYVDCLWEERKCRLV